MMDIRLGDEIHFRNGEVSRVTDVHEMYQSKGFYLELTTAVHGFIGDNYVASYWGYNPEGTVIYQDNDLVGNDIVEVIHKGIDDFLHLYRGDVIITSNGSEAKIAEDVVLLEKYTSVHLQDKINVNTEGYRASKQVYVSVDRDSLLIPSTIGPDTRIIKIIRGDRNEEKDV